MGLFSFGKKEVLFMPGCHSNAFENEIIKNYRKILKKINISFREIEDLCCGGFLDEAGYEKELRKNAKKVFETLEKEGIKKIITSCPLCYLTFNKYKELLPLFNIEIEFLLDKVFEAMKNDPKIIREVFSKKITYYDSCYLARYMNYIDKPREILKMIGFNIQELKFTKEETLCCGSCGNLPITNKLLSEDIAKDFLNRVNENLITADNHAYTHLKKLGAEILHISEVISIALGLKKNEIYEE